MTPVSINIGGTTFTTTPKTVIGSNVLSALVPNQPNEPAPFFDRNPITFAAVLDFLRSGLVATSFPRRALLAEASYFGIPTLVDACWSGIYELDRVIEVATNETSPQPPPAAAIEFKGQHSLRLHASPLSAPLPELWLNHPPLVSMDGSGDYLRASSVHLDLTRESFAAPQSPWYDVKCDDDQAFVVPALSLYGRHSPSLSSLRIYQWTIKGCGPWIWEYRRVE